MAKDLSILIPARNEEFLNETIDSILNNMEMDTEVIVVLDGQLPVKPIPDNKNVVLIYHAKSIGQRAATNEACRLSEAKYVMKLDAHCALDKGFDRKLIEDMQDDWCVVPMMYNLHAFDWVCECGHRRYQSPSNPCEKCGKQMKKEIIFKPRKSRCTWQWRFDKDLHFQYWSENKPQGDIVETMSLLGACWMLTRDKYWELNICDEEHGSWGQQGTEISNKLWLSGGKLMCNKKTWFSHLFRTQGGDFGFPYAMDNKQVEHAREYSKYLWKGNNWPLAKHNLDWLIDKFNPPGWNKTKGIVYYTDNKLKWSIAKACREQIKKSGLPIVSVSQKSADIGKNIVMEGESSKRMMFKQILTGLEASNEDIIFLCEHDVLYPKSHFNFTPKEKGKFYFNLNVCKVDYKTLKSLKVDVCEQLSGMCAYREDLINFVKEKLKEDPINGFEPKDTGNREHFNSEEPLIDIRHDNNLTKTRWNKEEFRNQKYTEGWEIGTCPEWGSNILKNIK